MAAHHRNTKPAGYPTLFDSKGRVLIGPGGASRNFILGKLDVAKPHDELYDTLVEELFRRFHPFADELNICFAKRGNRARTHAFKSAIERAEARFEHDYGARRSATVSITASTPVESTGLQAVDYFLWALQRYFERGEDRYVELIWPKVVEVHALDQVTEGRHGARHIGVTYNEKRPLIGNQQASE